MSSRASAAATACASKTAPPLSAGEAGTQDGIIILTSSGVPAASAIMKSTPSMPHTLAISCGSATTVVVPQGTTASAKREGISWLLSIWTCASMKPGSAKSPPQSSPSPRFSPTAAIRPFLKAMSALPMPPARTSSARQFFRTLSNRFHRRFYNITSNFPPPRNHAGARSRGVPFPRAPRFVPARSSARERAAGECCRGL